VRLAPAANRGVPGGGRRRIAAGARATGRDGARKRTKARRPAATSHPVLRPVFARLKRGIRAAPAGSASGAAAGCATQISTGFRVENAGDNVKRHAAK